VSSCPAERMLLSCLTSSAARAGCAVPTLGDRCYEIGARFVKCLRHHLASGGSAGAGGRQARCRLIYHPADPGRGKMTE